MTVMDRSWDNRTTNKTTGPGQSHAATSDVPAQSPDIWDFERVSHDSTQANFNFNRRVATQPYRVVGEGANAPAVAVRSQAGPKTQPSYAAPTTSRPNRYNAGVKVVAGDIGPAPWEDWQPVSYLKLPIMGEVAAGRYDVTIAYHEPGSDVDADFVLVNSEEIKVGRNTFALRVRGQSMIDNEIDNGDIIIVQSQDWADDGDFVIACLTDSTDSAGFVTLKRFYRHRQADRVVLQPANQALSPIHILPRKGDAGSEDLDGVKIQGRVTAIIKSGTLY